MVDKQPFKILMTTDTVGGVWTYCMELCKSLKEYETEIHLVTMGDCLKSWQKQEASTLQHIVVHETNFILEWMQNPWLDIEECGEYLLHLEEEIQPDIIHLNCYAYGSLPFKSPKIIVAHSDVYSWFLSVKKDDPPADWNQYYWCVKNGLKAADTVVAPSLVMMNFIKNIYSIKGEQKIIYNGRSKDLFNVDQKQPYVFSMGRIWDEAKNIKLVVDAASKISASIKIAGANEFAENSFHLAHSNVEYVGKLSTPQVAKYLSKASLYVLPATYEPFGLSALEAAFSGCALVLGDIESLHEIWGDAAFYVDTNDKDALADAVNYLLENEDVRRHYAQKALAQAQKYTTEVMARNYWKLYEELKSKSEASDQSKNSKTVAL